MLAIVPRVGLCLALLSDYAASQARLRTACLSALDRLRLDASIWAGLRDEEASDAFDRGLSSIGYPINSASGASAPNAAIQVSLPAATPHHVLPRVLDELLRSLGECVDPRASAAVLGEGFRLLPGTERFAMAYVGRRDASKSRAEFADWWTSHHGPLNLRSGYGRHLSGYELTLSLTPLSPGACNAANVDGSYDLFETLFVSDWQPLLARTLEELMAGAAADEKGYFQSTSTRGCLCREVVSA